MVVKRMVGGSGDLMVEVMMVVVVVVKRMVG